MAFSRHLKNFGFLILLVVVFRTPEVVLKPVLMKKKVGGSQQKLGLQNIIHGGSINLF